MIPIILKYNWDNFSPAYDILPFLPMIIMGIAYGWSTCTVKMLPPFIPNEYLYEKHADKGKEKWEIYAWAVRDVMLKHSGMEKTNLSMIDLFQYQRSLGIGLTVHQS